MKKTELMLKYEQETGEKSFFNDCYAGGITTESYIKWLEAKAAEAESYASIIARLNSEVISKNAMIHKLEAKAIAYDRLIKARNMLNG